MSHFIIDEKSKRIHSSDDLIPRLCQLPAIDNDKAVYILSEDEVRNLLLYKDYNGCPYCLQKFYLKQMAFKK